MSRYDPDASEGLSFWERQVYGDAAAPPEVYERFLVAQRLLNCHSELIRLTAWPPPVEVRGICDATELGNLLANEACGHLLESVATILHLPSLDDAKHQLLDISLEERDRRLWTMARAARPLEDTVTHAPQ
jgi:hypothetical protein